MDWAYPVRGGYKQRDKSPADVVNAGDYVRVNWILHEYLLMGKYPSVHEADDIVRLDGRCFGDPVQAIRDGRVIHASKVYLSNGQPSSWGKLIVLQHALPDGRFLYSRYAHLSLMVVMVGDLVQTGQVIGAIGDADGMLAPHLHFGISYSDLLLKSPTEWPSSGHTAAQAISIIEANDLDPLFYLRGQLMVSNPDTKTQAALTLQAMPADGPVTIIPGVPDPQDPTKAVTAYELTASDVLTLGTVTPPPPPPPPTSNAVTKYVAVTDGVHVRSAPNSADSSNVVGGLAWKTAVKVAPAVVNGTAVAGWDQIAEGQFVGDFVFDANLSLTLPN